MNIPTSTNVLIHLWGDDTEVRIDLGYDKVRHLQSNFHIGPVQFVFPGDPSKTAENAELARQIAQAALEVAEFYEARVESEVAAS